MCISEYDIEDKNCYNKSEKLCVGFIVECELDSDFGIIYQYNDESYSTECKNGGLYFFYKQNDFVIPQKTLVSFIKNFRNSWKRNFEVTNVCRLDEFENYILTSSEEIESYNKTSSTKKMRRMMSEGKKFIVVHYDEESRDLTSRLYYPIININQRIINYYFFTACSSFGPRTVFESYSLSLASKYYLQYSHIERNFKRILNYINSLNVESVLDMYSVFYGGYFQSRLGRDDHYLYTRSTLCTSNDPYLCQLTKLSSEVTDYYSSQGRDSDDFSSVNPEETQALRDEIKLKYNPTKHLLYLNKFYAETINRLLEDVNVAKNLLSNFIRKGHEYIFTQKFCSLSQWEDFISSFNRF